MGQNPNQQFNAFSMYNIAYAITNNDWTLQDETMASTDWTPPATFAGNLQRLKSIDFSDVDIITIAHSTNDFDIKTALSSDDKYDTATFEGSLRTIIETIQSKYPHIKIVLCTPIYRAWLDKNNNYEFLYDSTTYEINGVKLTDFVQATKNIAAEYSLCSIDNYYGSGICYDNRTESFNSTDNVHPNDTGRRMIAENMAKELHKFFG